MARTRRNARAFRIQTRKGREGRIVAPISAADSLRIDARGNAYAFDGSEAWRIGSKRSAKRAASRLRRRMDQVAIQEALAEDFRPLLTPDLVEEAWAEYYMREDEARMARWEAEEAVERQRLIDAGDEEGLYLFDNPAYAKWKERQEERLWYTEAMAKAWAFAYRTGKPLPERMEYPWDAFLEKLAA